MKLEKSSNNNAFRSRENQYFISHFVYLKCKKCVKSEKCIWNWKSAYMKKFPPSPQLNLDKDPWICLSKNINACESA